MTFDPSRSRSAQRTSRIAVIVMATIALVGSGVMTYFMHRSSVSLVVSLDGSDPATVSYSLSVLRARKDPAGIAKGTNLLTSPDEDVWTEAALYLGALGKAQSIPYLIRALKDADERDGPEISVDLTAMTGEDFGTKYADWNAWWRVKSESKSMSITQP